MLRQLWIPLYVLWLRLRVAIWGTSAFEHAVFHCPPWLALGILKAMHIPVGEGIDFHGRLHLHGTYDLRGKLKIGAWCHIGPGVTLDLSAPILLEDRCTLSLRSTILTHEDVGYSPLRESAFPTRSQGVTVETGAYIGAGATLLMGVRVGRCAVVGAGALVREDVPPYTVVAGVPARVIRRLDRQLHPLE
ncbi:MAG: acyltransferase [Anaerolineae bacterium]|nr:acyltransferase [Anaerolineae bacterium]